jgi:hypothetical protein
VIIGDNGTVDETLGDGAVYWKRCCLQRFPAAKCDPRKHGNSWKATYFELLIASLLEKFIPEVPLLN